MNWFTKQPPGSTPIPDVSGLKVEGITLMSELNEYEAANIKEAIAKYLVFRIKRKGFAFDFFFSLTLHEERLGNVWEWAGKTRQVNLNMGCEWYLVEQQLYALFQDLPCWKDDPWLAQAAMLHHRAVSIHPFMNGNGRWARLLANIWLRVNRQPFTVWPGEVTGGESEIRDEYIAAMKEADDGNNEPLIALHARYTR